MSKDQVGTLGQVIEMQPGDKAWINFSFDAIVTGVEERTSQKGSPFCTAELKDPHNDSIRCEVTIFGRKTFPFEGCLCNFSGQGMRRDEYNGKAKVVGSTKTTVNKLGDAPRSASSGSSSSADNGNGAAQSASAPADSKFIHGQTVGMAINNAVSLVRERLPADAAEARKLVLSPEFSRTVYCTASDILRISRMLERGDLADSAKDRALTPEQKAAKEKADAEEKAKAEQEAKAAQEKAAAEQRRLEDEAKKSNKPQPGPGGTVDTSDVIEDDVPF